MMAEFQSPPVLPTWIEDELPYDRRVFVDGEHRMHFVDHGEGPPIMLLHGNPTWCYLWRTVIYFVTGKKVRVIAPDLIGLGFSSKPTDPAIHTLDFHAARISALIRALDLEDLTIVGQDWGGAIIAVAAARNPERIRGAVFANTAIRVPTKKPRVSLFHWFAHVPVLSTLAFRVFGFPLPVLQMVQGDPSSISRYDRRAYRHPLRNIRDRIAPLALARLVPRSLDDPTYDTLREANDWAHSFTGPVRLVWGMRDPILGRAVHGMKKLFPDAPVLETQAGHFLQEEVPADLAAAIFRVIE